MNYLANRPKMYLGLIGNVLDELYNQLPGEIDKDKVIKCRLEYLSGQYRELSDGAKVNYADPITRFAYIYCHMPIHINIVYQLITDSPVLKCIFTADEIRISCLGAGPGSDVLGIVKFLQIEKKTVWLNCGLYDSEIGWTESWKCIYSKLSSQLKGLLKDSFYQPLDVTNSRALVVDNEIMSTDLFTLSFILSEVCSKKNEVDIFFEKLFKHAKQGSLFLFVEYNAPEFYGWIDTLISVNKLVTIEKPNWGQISADVAVWGGFELYNHRLDHSPKLHAHITYRLCRKE